VLATLSVDLSTPRQHAVPLSVSLDAVTALPAEQLQLLDATGTAVAFQISPGKPRQLIWLSDQSGTTVNYELRVAGDAVDFPQLRIDSRDGLLILGFDEQDLLGYQFEWLAPPQGVDPVYGRSAFIHPLWSPGGQVLTRIQPDDHYHHYGIWNPWTHLEYGGREYDLWNLAEKQGTVRFGKFESRISGPVYAEYTALHEHVAYVEDRSPVVIMNELQTVRVYRPHGQAYYLMDMTIDLSAATETPVTLLEYRYGGFGWRATEQWDKDNSEVLSSEGRDRSDVDSTLGRWFYVQGEIDDAYAGAVVMSHPDNFNHPEPMRIWPVTEDNGGEVFASFSPTKNTDWVISPGKNYKRTYRFLVYNGHMDRQNAETAWQDFAAPPGVIAEPAH
jgi:hypothetical protein